MKHKPLNEYAEEILSDCHCLSEPAFEYAKAMKELDQITDMYMNDTAKSVVLYFLANASTWSGETAKRVKKELNKIVKDAT